MDREEYTRREFLRKSGSAAASLAAVSGGLAYAQKQTADNKSLKGRPNVLILRNDEHNPRISTIEGHPFIKTPNMERLAKMGVVYENHYCPSPVCCSSRSAFISGRRVHEIQTYNTCCVVKFDYPSYGQVLREQGVHSVFVGKVDAYRDAKELGFSEMFGKGVRNPGDLNFRRNPIIIRPLEKHNGGFRHKDWGPVDGYPDRFKSDDKRVETALNWLKTKAVTMDAPWTMEVNISNPHFPQYVTKELWDMYEGHADLPKYGFDCAPARHPYAQDLQNHFQTKEFPEESIRGLRRGYYGCVTYADRKLGQILDTLEQTGLIDNTIVAYTSDHGEMLGKFGMWWKCSLYEDSARVPLIIAGPGFGKNARDKTAVDQLDLQATIFKATGCARPAGWSGTALQDIPANDPNKVAFCEYHGHGVRASAYMVRKNKWKFIWNFAAPNQLFDIDADPDEQHNLFTEKADVAADMERQLRKICDPEAENARAEEFIQREMRELAMADLQFERGGHARLLSDKKKTENYLERLTWFQTRK